MRAEHDAPPPVAARGRWWSASRGWSLALLAALLLLEALPVQAWLVLFGPGEALAAAPLWYVLLVLIVARTFSLRFGARGVLPAFLMSLPVVLAALTLLVRISPAAYGGVASSPLDTAWLAVLAQDVVTGSVRLRAAFWLLPLLLYVWWRGLVLGSDSGSLPVVHRRFRVGMAALVLAIIGTTGLPAHVRGSTGADLTVLLLVEVFAGLMASALMRVATTRFERTDSAAAWLRSAALLSAGIVGLALLLSLVINFQTLGATLTPLRPVADLLGTVIAWLVTGIARVLFFIFDGVIQLIGTNHKPQPLHLPRISCPPSGCNTHSTLPAAMQQATAIAATVILIASALAVLALLIRATIKRRAHPPAIPDEEREALDARSLLGAQLRALLRSRRRPQLAREEALPAGSVRHLYREMLHAAAQGGVPRHDTETPDEFAARLATHASLELRPEAEQRDLIALTEAYDAARYAEQEPDRARGKALTAGVHRLTRRLRGDPSARR
jgi:hypothetical protein